MSEIFQTDPDLARIEFLLQQSNYAEAEAYLSRRIDRLPFDRKTRFYLLLVNVNIYGPQPFEQEIDKLRECSDFDENERNIVRRIFLVGYRLAEKNGEEAQTWAYQRLLRRLLLGQPLDQPIPRSSPSTLSSSDDNCPELDPAMQAEGAELEKAFVADKRRRATGSLPMGKSIIRLAVVSAACGLMMAPFLYVGLWRTRAPARPAASASYQAPVSAGKPTIPEKLVAAPTLHATGRVPEERPPELAGSSLSNTRNTYNRWFGTHLAGGVLLQLKLDRGGRVTEVRKISSRLADEDVVNTAIQEARQWKFSGGSLPGNEITVTLLLLSKDPAGSVIAKKKPEASHAKTTKTFPLSAPVRDAARPIDQAKNLQLQRKVQQQQQTTGALHNQPSAPEVTRPIGIATTKRGITLRKEPRFAAATVEHIAGGISVRVLEVRGRWLKVKTAGDETAGFVRREFLSPVQSKN
ncbi:MAG TPA: hypothetical protein VE131_05680 [Terriglobales bacterium]|nr:hypothetical protein [Terriglobales bacterium]